MKYLRTKEQVLENFNPYLDGSTSDGVDFTSICFDPNYELPNWMRDDSCPDPKAAKKIQQGDTDVRSDRLIPAAIYFNNNPMSAWSAQFGAHPMSTKKNLMQNYHNATMVIKQMFPNGIAAYLNMKTLNDQDVITISGLRIMQMVPCSHGLGLNIYVRFKLNDMEEEIWGKFLNVGNDSELGDRPQFITPDMKNFDKESQIRVVGRVWSHIKDWFKVKPGVYRSVAREIIVQTELGQYVRILEGDAIDVIHSDENRIKAIYKEKTVFIKKPVYYWFNWYMIKI